MRLQSKFLLSIIPCIAIALLSLGAVVYFQLLHGSRSALDREAGMTLERAEWRLKDYIGTVEVTANLLSDSAQIADWYVEGYTAKSKLDKVSEVLTLFRKVRNTHPEFREIRLLSRNGSEQVRLADPTLANVIVSEAGSQWFSNVGLNWAASIYSVVAPHSDDGKISLTVTKPIRLNASGTSSGVSSRMVLHGYLVISTEIDKIGRKMADSLANHGGYLLLLDDNNEILYSPEDFQSKAATVAKAILNRGSLSDEEKTVLLVDVDGEQLRVAVRQSVDGLKVVTVIPDSESNAVRTRIGIAVAVVTFLAIALLSLFFMVLMQTIVLNPISRLQQKIVALGEGRSTTTLDVMRQDELGELANEFQIMSVRLSKSMIELQESHAEIEELAYMDGLTKLPNRRRFLQLFDLALERLQSNDMQAALLFIDLDGFKDVNDTEGHRVGDQLLQLVAERLTQCVCSSSDKQEKSAEPEMNLVARIGGDEFVVLLNITHGSNEASLMVDKMQKALAIPVQIGSKIRGITCSVGIALYPNHATDSEGLIVCADTAMYEAKRLGRQSSSVFNPALRNAMQLRVELSEDLREALDNQLYLQYQPQFNVEDSTMCGVEALLRWKHPLRGLIPPCEFIPIAEDTGLIKQIGSWVIDEACRQWSEWHANGIAPDRIAVNVSQRQFTLDDIAATVISALERHNMPPDALEVEITESCMMDAPQEIMDALDTLRTIGVNISLDDFGTGYSSLSLLAELPINTLKIDRQFVSGVEAGQTNDKILAAIMNLATTLNLTVVGEGVETESELDRLRTHGCHIAQGYLLAKPMWEFDLVKLLNARHNESRFNNQKAC